MSDRISTSAYRLSCHCLTAFYLAPRIGEEVVCQECEDTVQVAFRYPSLSSTCGQFGKEDGIVLRCTKARKHPEKFHYDGPLERDFTNTNRLRASNEGNTGRA